MHVHVWLSTEQKFTRHKQREFQKMTCRFLGRSTGMLLATLLVLAVPGCCVTSSEPAEPPSPCPAGTVTVRLVKADLTPTGLDAYSTCAAPDVPELYGLVWCCPVVPGQ